MKTLISVYLFLSVALNVGDKLVDVPTNGNSYEVKKIKATFDGAEGNYFFFTDVESKALQFEDIEPALAKKLDLINGDYVGKTFEVHYKDTKIIDLVTVKE